MSTKKKIFLNMAGIIFMCAAFATITWALFFHLVSVDNNFFQTGYVEIELTNGVSPDGPVFGGDDLALAPGNSVTKPMVLKNKSSDPVHYRIYVENVSGDLQYALLFRIYDENHTLLKTVVLADFNDGDALESDVPLAIGGEKTFYIEAAMNECAGNEYEGRALTFDFVAKAVQSKNNPTKEF